MRYALPSAVFLIALALTLLARNLVLRWMRRYTEVVDSVRLASVLWCFVAAVQLALHYTELPPRVLDRVDLIAGAFVIASIALVVSNAIVRALAVYGGRHKIPYAGSGLSRALARVLVLAIGATFLLHYLGLDVKPILTAFGIGGLAVALALQDTLANFFAGLHILVETPITIGDSIKLASGEEGVVTDIGWRTTRVLTGGNSIIVIPNTKITSSTLTNFSLPEARISAEVPIYVGHDAEIDRVAQIVLDVAAATEGVLEKPAPVVLFDPGVTPTHIEFKAVLNLSSGAVKGIVLSEFRARLFEEFRDKRVPLPDPQRFVWSEVSKGHASGA